MSKMNFRIFDVNINRLQESLRVIEDIARFEYNDKQLVEKTKNIRHKIKEYIKKHKFLYKLISARDVGDDTGKFLDPDSEFKRDSINDVFIANIKRIQECSRVLEELCKIYNEKFSKFFKKIRFKSYEIEKDVFSKYIKES